MICDKVCLMSCICCPLYWTPLKYHDARVLSIATRKKFRFIFFCALYCTIRTIMVSQFTWKGDIPSPHYPFSKYITQTSHTKNYNMPRLFRMFRGIEYDFCLLRVWIPGAVSENCLVTNGLREVWLLCCFDVRRTCLPVLASGGDSSQKTKIILKTVPHPKQSGHNLFSSVGSLSI